MSQRAQNGYHLLKRQPAFAAVGDKIIHSFLYHFLLQAFHDLLINVYNAFHIADCPQIPSSSISLLRLLHRVRIDGRCRIAALFVTAAAYKQ